MTGPCPEIRCSSGWSLRRRSFCGTCKNISPSLDGWWAAARKYRCCWLAVNGALRDAVPSCSVHSPIHCKVTKDDPVDKRDEERTGSLLRGENAVMGCGPAVALSKILLCCSTKCCRSSSSSSPEPLCACPRPQNSPAHSSIKFGEPAQGRTDKETQLPPVNARPAPALTNESWQPSSGAFG